MNKIHDYLLNEYLPPNVPHSGSIFDMMFGETGYQDKRYREMNFRVTTILGAKT